MPHDQSAAAAPGVTGANPADTGESDVAAVSTSVPETTAAELLREANLPDEVVKAFTEDGDQRSEVGDQRSEVGDQKSEGEQPSEEDQAKATDKPAEIDEEASEEESELEPEAKATEEDVEAADEQPEGDQPKWFQKRLNKWTRQKERLQEQIDELREQVSGKQKEEVRGQKSEVRGGETAFEKISNFEELQTIVDAQRSVRDWCMDNPDGVVLGEGTPQERVISPEEVRKTLIGATRIIEDAPKKAQELQTRAQWHQIAQIEWPELFDKSTEIYQTSQQFLKQYPEIDRNPNRDFLLGLMVEGWKPFQQRMLARQSAQKSEVGGQKSEGSNGTNGQNEKTSLPEALKRKIPPIPKTQAPNPPRGSRRASPQDEAAAAVERLVQEGGSQEAAMAAIAAIERQNAVSGGTKRAAAPV